LTVYTDSSRFAATVLPQEVTDRFVPVESASEEIRPFLGRIFPGNRDLFCAPWEGLPFRLLMTEHASCSQYDQLIELARETSHLPDRVACLAGSGRGFHGFKGRPWAARPGNIHLSVFLAPNAPVESFQVAFTGLAALSVAEALDQISGLSARPRIKWVNDVLLEEKKVAGILAYTQSRDTTVTSAVLGFGLNVETTPSVEPTPFVPEVGSLRDYLPPGAPDARGEVLFALLQALEENYRTLLSEGPRQLLARYRGRSLVMGQEVTVCPEASDDTGEVVAQGRVTGLGEALELILEGRSTPVTSGRLIMGLVDEKTEHWEEAGIEATEPRPAPEGCIHV